MGKLSSFLLPLLFLWALSITKQVRLDSRNRFKTQTELRGVNGRGEKSLGKDSCTVKSPLRASWHPRECVCVCVCACGWGTCNTCGVCVCGEGEQLPGQTVTPLPALSKKWLDLLIFSNCPQSTYYAPGTDVDRPPRMQQWKQQNSALMSRTVHSSPSYNQGPSLPLQLPPSQWYHLPSYNQWHHLQSYNQWHRLHSYSQWPLPPYNPPFL